MYIVGVQGILEDLICGSVDLPLLVNMSRDAVDYMGSNIMANTDLQDLCSDEMFIVATEIADIVTTVARLREEVQRLHDNIIMNKDRTNTDIHPVLEQTGAQKVEN